METVRTALGRRQSTGNSGNSNVESSVYQPMEDSKFYFIGFVKFVTLRYIC